MSTTTPIGVHSVVDYLTERGIPTGDDPTVTPLVGGVSGIVLLVETGSARFVVKQALDQLLVESDWFAKPERALTEAAAITALHSLTPNYLPDLVDASAAECALVMTAAPAEWDTWKARLLTGQIDGGAEIATASTLGFVLGSWHRRTAGDTVIAQRFNDYEAFEQLRVAPFHRTILARHTVLTTSIQRCIDDLSEGRQCLVHGDFSPKNILVSPGDPRALWVLDFEVAHYGAAVFDLAFLHTHLLLKAIHRADYAPVLRDLATAFQVAYIAEAGEQVGPRATVRLGWHTACLLLARVDGTSPAGYLTGPGRDRVRELATYILSTPDRPIADLWALLTEENREEESDGH